MSNSLIPPTYGNTNKLVKPKNEYNLVLTKGETNALEFNSVGSPIYFSLEPKFNNNTASTIVYMEVKNNEFPIFDEMICYGARSCNYLANLNDKIISNNNSPNFNGSTLYELGLAGSDIQLTTGNCGISTETSVYMSNGKALSFFGLNGEAAVIKKISRMNVINPNKYEFWFYSRGNSEGSGTLGASLGPTRINTTTEWTDVSFNFLYRSGTNIGSLYCPHDTYIGSLLNRTWYKAEFNTYNTVGGSSYNFAVYDSGTTPSLIHSVSGLSFGGNTQHLMLYNKNFSPPDTDQRYANAFFDDIVITGSGIYTENTLTFSYYSGNGGNFTTHYSNQGILKVVSGY